MLCNNLVKKKRDEFEGERERAFVLYSVKWLVINIKKKLDRIEVFLGCCVSNKIISLTV